MLIKICKENFINLYNQIIEYDIIWLSKLVQEVVICIDIKKYIQI